MKQILSHPAATTSSAPPVSPVITIHLVLDVPGFADRWKVSRRTVWSWLAEGIPHFKLGERQNRFNVLEADRWVETRFSRRREK